MNSTPHHPTLSPLARKILSCALFIPLLAAFPAVTRADTCVKSASVSKGLPIMITHAQIVPVPIGLVTCTGSPAECGGGSGTCNNPATVLSGTITARLTRVGYPNTYYEGMLNIQPRGAHFVSKTETVSVNVPATAPIGNYAVTCTAAITFSADGSVGYPQTYTVSGDTEVTFGREKLPVSVEALHKAVAEVPPEKVFEMQFRVKNNDPTRSITFQGHLSARQSAHLPVLKEGPPPANAISFAENIKGRGFNVAFIAKGCPQPDLDHGKPKALTADITLGPKGSETDTTILYAVTKPLPGARSGSGSEYVFKYLPKGGGFEYRVGSALIVNSHPKWWEFWKHCAH